MSACALTALIAAAWTLVAADARAQQEVAAGQRPASGATVTTAQPTVKTHRWFDVQTGAVDARYRYIQSSADLATVSQLQHRQTLRAAFKFDSRGRYTLQTGLATGNAFTPSWDPTGVGTGDPSWTFLVRTLYAAAKPVRGVEVQIGGLAPIRGESTEITSYDNDGFLVGERVSVKRPESLYVDEVSVTLGYLGDLTTPNVFRRLDRMGDHNYTQLLAAKTLSARFALSADWTSAADVDTWREAVRIATKETGVVDALRLELYQRVDAPDGRGFALSAEKAMTKRLALTGGYASIDRDDGLLNGDRFQRGKRLFVEGRVSLTRELGISVFYTRAVANDFPIANKTRFDAILSYNVLEALRRAGAL